MSGAALCARVKHRGDVQRALALTLVAAALATPAAAHAPSYDGNGYEAKLFALVNAERARHGLRRLGATRCAAGFASRWADRIAHERAVRHQSVRRVVRACEARRAAENVAMGKVTPEHMMRLWMKSRRHRANILNPHLTHIGVGAGRDGSGRWYGVQVFLGY